ncbi:hypothetical protein [Lacticaseibacillus rhamnosus]|uniref:hypothetical protein n=1 Tax=Lacticaseibacillus rhamnosus TaxID=47715 RepID=UPI001CDCB291|nr:hypothetical protein [Lacticaseibacillus rhamnosus]
MLSVDTSQLTVPKGKKGVKQKLTLISAGIRVYGHCIGCNDQSPVITPKATYVPVSNRAGSRSLSITRSPAQKPACKDLERNGQKRAITSEAAYTPVSNRAGSRSVLVAVFPKNQYNETQQNFKGGVFGAEKEKEQIPENDDY